MEVDMVVRALVGAPVARSRPPVPQYGEFGMVRRERKGRHAGFAFSADTLPVRYEDGETILSTDDLWRTYRIVPDVRAGVNDIVRRVSTWKWRMVPTVDPSDPRRERALEVCETCRRFLASPNLDGETWQTVMTKGATDLMVFDAMALELVRGGKTGLAEIVPRRGGDVMPIVDKTGRLLRYVQYPSGRGQPDLATIPFRPEDMAYLNLWPNTTRVGGNPLIEAIVNEVITIMRSSQHLMLAFDADEVPPGILLIAGVAGKAAEQVKASLKNMRGQDNNLRILTTNNPRALSANWVELRHTPKDLALKELTHEVRRVIWRVLGVKPVSMGDTEATPRATAEVQLDASESHLILPILMAIQGLFNTRIVPRAVGDAKDAELVQFEFDLDTKLTPEQELQKANAADKLARIGVKTTNEVRSELNLKPYGPEGDVALVWTTAGPVPLTAVVVEPEPVTDEEPPAPEGDDDGDGSVEDPESDAPDDDDDSPGESDAEATRPAPSRIGRASYATTRWTDCVEHDGCEHEPTRDVREARDLLPSAWSAPSRFKGRRVMSLPALADAVSGYRRDVSPLYDEARSRVVEAFDRVLSDERLTVEEAVKLNAEVPPILERMVAQWSMRTLPRYHRAAAIGRDAAADFTGAQVVPNWRALGDAYHDRAMGWLVADKGLVTDIRYGILAIASATTRAIGLAARDAEGIQATVDVARILAAVSSVFARNEHRIDHWSGRLVELANDTMVTGLTAEPPKTPEVEWYCEWVASIDGSTCPTCRDQAAAGFRPLSALRTRPGGATECRAACRCVLVLWSKSEVDDGSAVKLNGKV